MNRYQAFEMWELLEASERFPYIGKPQRARVMENLTSLLDGFEVNNNAVMTLLVRLNNQIGYAQDPLAELFALLKTEIAKQDRHNYGIRPEDETTHWSKLEPSSDTKEHIKDCLALLGVERP